MEIFLDIDSEGVPTESGVEAVNPTGYMLRIHPKRQQLYLLKVDRYENNGDGSKQSPNKKYETVIGEKPVDLKKIVPKETWDKGRVPISVNVKNTPNGKSLSMSINNQEIKFNNKNTIEYKSTSQKITVGVGTSKGRTMEVAEVTIRNK